MTTTLNIDTGVSLQNKTHTRFYNYTSKLLSSFAMLAVFACSVYFFSCSLLMRKALFEHLTARGIQVKLLLCTCCYIVRGKPLYMDDKIQCVCKMMNVHSVGVITVLCSLSSRPLCLHYRVFLYTTLYPVLT